MLTLSNPTGGASIADATGTIAIGASPADPVATPGISAPPDVVVGEADGYVDLPVRLSAPGLVPITVIYEHELQLRELWNVVLARAISSDEDGNAELRPRRDDQGRPRAVPRLPRGRGPRLLPFTVSTPSNATIARATTLVSIVNASTVVTSPLLFARDAVVDEKDGSVRVPVLLGGPAGQTSTNVVTVHYATANGTATAGADYAR